MKAKTAAVFLALVLFGVGAIAADSLSIAGTSVFGASEASAVRSGSDAFVAHAFLDGMELYLLESIDAGASFSNPSRVFEDRRAFKPHPSIVLDSNSEKWVFFQNKGLVFFTTSAMDYNFAYAVDANTYPNLFPSAVRVDESFHLFYNTDNGKIFEQVSGKGFDYAKIVWGNEVFLDGGKNPGGFADSSGTIWLAFDEGNTIYLKKNIGGEWKNSESTGFSGENPSIAVDGAGTVFLAFEREGNIYYAKSVDSGANWGDETLLDSGANAEVLGLESGAMVFFDSTGTLYKEQVS